MTLHVFIDTNIWLSFYHYSSDDLEELRKLSVLVDSKKLVAYLPEQVRDEFLRNRDGKIADALKRLKNGGEQFQFPQICKDYEEYDTAKRALSQYRKAMSQLLEKLDSDIATSSLKADQTINELFGVIPPISTSADIYECASRRVALGNPPGKLGSLGDAINWETLLESVPNGEDLYIITDDVDFVSRVDKSTLNQYLATEWAGRKASTAKLFKRLSEFLTQKFPKVKLATELEKELLVRDLASSPTFRDTRRLLNRLVQVGDLSDAQVADLVEAAISNNQIYWISQDSDIKRNLKTLVGGREDSLNPYSLHQFREILGETSVEADEADEEPPF